MLIYIRNLLNKSKSLMDDSQKIITKGDYLATWSINDKWLSIANISHVITI